MSKRTRGRRQGELLYRKTDFRRAYPILATLEKDWRSQLRRDYARLLHCPAFRRLQGKTQLVSGVESDFFRNRLTHSLEVAQVAKSIALKLNFEVLERKDLAIDTDLVEFAGLAHDLGHPPFGHAGEHVLNDLMREYGGFEGNAQTLRILCRLEKKLDSPDDQLDEQSEPIWFTNGREAGVGLNLCARTLASVLKYDKVIPPVLPATGIAKGYYASEADVVSRLKADVAPNFSGTVKTVECQIMDLADDIAYSTYDIEDAFKANLMTPLNLVIPDQDLIKAVAVRAQKGLGDPSFDAEQALAAATRTLAAEFIDLSLPLEKVFATAKYYAVNGFLRNVFTSSLVRRFVDGVRFELNERYPCLSRVYFDRGIHEEVEVLKHFTYEMMINSHRLKIVARRAEFILKEVFRVLCEPGGFGLLPPDYTRKYRQAVGNTFTDTHSAIDNPKCMRVICDFVAGMTDKYAVEFFSRLRSESYQTIFREY